MGLGPAGGLRVGKGDVRAAILLLLAEGPANGYQLINAIERHSGGVWRPSPGSVYPALNQLEDEGLIEIDVAGGPKAYRLTSAGRGQLKEHRPKAPWDAVAEGVDQNVIDLRSLADQITMAAMQVATTGSDAGLAQARQILAGARRDLYRILAGDMTEAGESSPPFSPNETGDEGGGA